MNKKLNLSDKGVQNQFTIFSWMYLDLDDFDSHWNFLNLKNQIVNNDQSKEEENKVKTKIYKKEEKILKLKLQKISKQKLLFFIQLYKNEKIYEYFQFEMDIKYQQFWMFFAISIDKEQNLRYILQPQKNFCVNCYQQKQKIFEDYNKISQNTYVNLNFNFKNQDKEYNSYVRNFDISYFAFDELKVLQYYDVFQKQDQVLLNLFFNKDNILLNQKIKDKNFSHYIYNYEEYQHTVQNKIELGSYNIDKLQTFTLILEFDLQQLIHNINLLTVNSKENQSFINLYIKPEILNNETQYYLNFKFYKQETIAVQKILRLQNKKMTLAFSLVKNAHGQITVLVFDNLKKYWEFKDKQLNEIEQFKVSIFDKNKKNNRLRIYQVQIVNGINSFVLFNQNNENLQKCFSHCHIPFQLDGKHSRCLKCKNTVLDIKKQQCQQYCHLDTQNFNQSCLDCKENKCYDRQVDVEFERISNNTFIYQLSKQLKNIYNVPVQLQIEPIDKENQLEYQQEQLTKHSYKVQFHTQRTLYDLQLKFFLGQDDKKVFDEHKNEIDWNDILINVKTIRKWEKGELQKVKISAQIIKTILYITYIYGFLYLAVSFKYNNNELMGKKILQYAQSIQFTTIFMFFNVIYPPNAFSFLSRLLEISISFKDFRNGFFDTDDQYQSFHSNMYHQNMKNFLAINIMPNIYIDVGQFFLWVFVIYSKAQKENGIQFFYSTVCFILLTYHNVHRVLFQRFQNRFQ